MSLGLTRIGRTTFEWGKRTYIMGIVNTSPDSFSGDGTTVVVEAVAQAQQMLADGADMIDVGGQSTRPDYAPVSAEEEIRRVVPVIEALAKLDAPVSIDTYRYEVARRALDAGAVMLNDVWGLRQEPKLAVLAAERRVPIIVAANQRTLESTPLDSSGLNRRNDKPNIMEQVTTHLKSAVKALLEAGVPLENIIIDPGIGFGKTVPQNLEVLNWLQEIRNRFSRPVLLGTSRKSFIGAVLDLPADRRMFGTAATTAIGIAHGADIVRVHDIREMRQVVAMSDAVVRGWEPPGG